MLDSFYMAYTLKGALTNCEVPVLMSYAGFPRGLEIMENLENQEKKFHAWKNHGI